MPISKKDRDAIHAAVRQLTEAVLNALDSKSSPATDVGAPDHFAERVRKNLPLTVNEVSEWTRIPVGTLRYWRYGGTQGPKSFNLGRRVAYRPADVQSWLDELEG